MGDKGNRDIKTLTFQYDDVLTDEGFHITSIQEIIEYARSIGADVYKPHRLGFYIVLYFTNGGGLHTVDFEEFEFSTGDLLWVGKNQVQTFDKNGEYSGYIVLLSDKFMKENVRVSEMIRLFHLINKSVSPKLFHPQEKSSFDHLFDSFYTEYKGRNDFAKKQISWLHISLLLFYLGREARHFAQDSGLDFQMDEFLRLKSVVEENISETRNVNEIANNLGISTKKVWHTYHQVRESNGKEVRRRPCYPRIKETTPIHRQVDPNHF